MGVLPTEPGFPLATTLEDEGRLACASATITGVYMPAGEYKIVPETGSDQVGATVLPPPAKVIITAAGTYAAGGICTIQANYKVSGLTNTVEVQYPTEDTIKVPSQDVEGLFYFPGCHLVHYQDQEVSDQLTPAEGEWEICFAAIPEKTMTIYYYQDNLTDVTPPWTALETTTANGMACAKSAYYSGVYTPVGK